MKKISKKEIQENVNSSLVNLAHDLNIAEPSKKTSKLIRKVSKKVSAELKHELKKQLKKMKKVSARENKAPKVLSA